jgi:antitoxin StbD
LLLFYGVWHARRPGGRGAEEFRAVPRLGEPVIVTSYGKPSVVILSIAEYERLKELDRRVLRLDEMSDAHIEEMTRAEIPPELRYSIDDIPDRD